MELKDHPGELYEVKFDSENNLCPVAENVNSKVRILLKNIPSCINYLKNKAG
jgi:hypothetical protein